MPEKDELYSQRIDGTANFISELAKESERSAVVFGASRADAVLEELLRAAIRPHPGGRDNLFDPDRPLGTFSARISLAFRLGLIDDACEHALQMLRKLRNDFAHSVTRASLSESHHKHRVTELVREAKKSPASYAQHLTYFKTDNATLRAFCAAVSVIITHLDYTTLLAKPLEAPFTARIDLPDKK